MTTYKLSPSSISLMLNCPRCFWLTQHKIWKRPDSPFPQLPNGMDRIIKAHFDRFMEKNELPPELKESECKHDGCKLFNDREKLNIWRNNLKGIRYEDEQGNILFGAVDNILVKGSKLIVLDYKTKGFPIKDEAQSCEAYQNQLDMYNFLLRGNGYDTEDYAFLLFYVPKEVLETGEVIFDTKLVKRKISVENAKNLFTGALNLLNEDCPSKSCEWCEGVRNGR